MGLPMTEDLRHDLGIISLPQLATHDVEKSRRKGVTIHKQTEIYLCGHKVVLLTCLGWTADS